MLSPSYEKSLSSGRRFSFQSALSRSRKSTDSFRGTADIPFSPLDKEDSDDDDQFGGYVNRSLFLRSYKFSRKETLPQKVKNSLNRLKSAAWTVIACNYMPTMSKRNRDTPKIRDGTMSQQQTPADGKFAM